MDEEAEQEGGFSFTDKIKGAYESVKSKVGTAVDLLKDEAEAKALEAAGVPSAIVPTIQQGRRDFGLPPITNASSLFIYGTIIVILIGIATQILYTTILGIIYFFGNGFMGNLTAKKDVVIFCICIGFVISYLLYYFYLKDVLLKNKIDIADTAASTLATLEGFENTPNNIADPSISLINIQALAVKQAAYTGPLEKDGTFSADIGINSALRVGIRFFILQIDYLDSTKDAKAFDPPLMPTLLYRDDRGVLISKNGVNIGDVAKMFAAYAFSAETPNSDKPLILYLHFLRTPNLVREPEKYLKYMSTVAQLLEPLNPYTIGSMPEGNFNRQKQEKILLTTSLRTFSKKVLYFSNADTSIFRNANTLGIGNIDPKYDLDYLVSMRVYLDNSSDKLGVTAMPSQGKAPAAVIVPFQRLKGLSEKDQDDFALKGKTRFVIAMPSQTGNPSIGDIENVLDHTAVNCIPFNLFGESSESLNPKLLLWKGGALYKGKSANLQALNLPAN